MTLQHKFVEFVPDILEDGVLYISVLHCSAIHKCVCGCGNEVVTPITPTDWQLSFNGKTVSLKPSIGNWQFECRSHYWITNNVILNASNWDDYRAGLQKKTQKKSKKKGFFSFVFRY
jgi:hypothetical protein